jgi:hypothetical protein
MTKWMRVAALMLLPVFAACTDDSDPIDNDDLGESVETIRLQIGTSFVDITDAGANPASVDVPRGATPVAASFLNANGTTVSLSSSSTYSVEVVSGNTQRLTFTRTGAFTGNFNGIQTGAVTVQVSLLHGSHTDFGPRSVTINVLPATDN